jgi:RNA polymerase sigma-70 factor (TIGR02960 family)
VISGDRALDLARTGDGEAFRQLTESHRRELLVHCYRLLGSFQDAEDVVQETLLAAWCGIDGFEGRASMRAWLYRIATNRCLNALRERGRRPPDSLEPPPFVAPEPARRDEAVLLEPCPDALVEGLPDVSAGPEARYESREAIQLAFVTALQHLPPRQRAALVLRDVLGFGAVDTARVLDSSEGSVKGALQRARATLRARLPAGGEPSSERENALAERFAEAFQNDDVEDLVGLLAEDAWLEMPPYPHAYQGPGAIAAFLRASARWRGGRRYRLLQTRANAQPAFASYLQDAGKTAAQPAGLIVLTIAGEEISRITRFMDKQVLRHFGLPEKLVAPR